MFWLVLALLLNFGISWWNCRVVGSIWDEMKVVGGFMKLVVWSAAIQSMIGFTMVAAFVYGGFAYVVGWLPPEGVEYLSSLLYVMLIIPALGTGLVLTIHSWIVAIRERSWTSAGVTAWNTYAQISNTISAFENFGPALSKVGEMFSSRDSDGDAKAKLAMLVILIGICAILTGVLATIKLIDHYRRTARLAAPKFNMEKSAA